MLKFLNLFIQDYCESNEIVADEKAGDKKGVGVVQSNFL